MIEHTPGPWERFGRDVIGPLPSGLTSMVCHVAGNCRDFDADIANARLIAAAPELLAAAQRILEGGYVSKHIEEERADYEQLSAAIAKATTQIAEQGDSHSHITEGNR